MQQVYQINAAYFEDDCADESHEPPALLVV
jgi:hypothetical protein